MVHRGARTAPRRMIDSVTMLKHHTEMAAQGWTTFPSFLSLAVVQQLRALLDPVFEGAEYVRSRSDPPERQKIGGRTRRAAEQGGVNDGAGILDCHARHPQLAQLCTRQLLLRPELLDFAELAMGRVQLDSMQLSGLAPALDHQRRRGEVGTAGWHRDGGNTTGFGPWWR
jgi:hypothetical protein